jgi:hypothetical protein
VHVCLLLDRAPAPFAPDITPGYQLLQVATAKGTTAGVGCAHSLRRAAPLPGGPPRAPDVTAEEQTSDVGG